MPQHLFDNRSDKRRVVNWLKSHLAAGAHLSVSSAYFTVNAYELLRRELDNLEAVRFLFGEPRFLKNLDPGRAQAAYTITDEGLKLGEQIRQNATARACADWMRKKVKIRSVRDGRLLHGKMYHVTYPGTEEARGDASPTGLFAPRDAALMGSSNFTVHGLGGSPTGGNVELNLVASDDRDREELCDWFNEVWADEAFTVDVKAEVLDYLERLSRDNAPEWVYYVTLWHLFRDRITRRIDGDETPEAVSWRESQIYRAMYSFQKHGAQGAIHKLLTYNGCILADSVGLGKTFEALAAIKYFELRREKVLVLCPKKLRENWSLYQSSAGSILNPFKKDDFRYTLLSHTDLSRDTGMVGDVNLANFDWGGFGLIVIDESHNFRNNTAGNRDENGDVIRKSRYQRLIEDVIGQGVKTRILLLSATPVNTNLSDLRNQIYLMSAGKVNQYDADKIDAAFDDTLGIPSLKNLTAQAQREFNVWAEPTKENAPRVPRELLEKLPKPFFSLLDELSIARSRDHIRRFYADDVATIGSFPTREPPRSLSPDIDLQNRFPTYDKLHQDISEYQLSIFKPSKYVKDEFRQIYETEKVDNFSQENRENFLIGMMRVNFLKRLESSVQSFEDSMRRTVEKITALEQKIESFKRHQDETDYVIGSPDTGGDADEEEQAAFEVTAVGYNLAHLRLDDWLKDLAKDKQQLARLQRAAEEVTPERDAKLAVLKALIAERAANPPIDRLGRPNRKVLVFTAFSDTAKYLYENLRAWARDEWGIESALVTGSGGNAATFGDSDFGSILTNFSPVSKTRARQAQFAQDRELDLLIATDCISEGQNLQDCGCVVNYDVHWNPVRLIQRFGRVDRLGSLHTEIQMVNFWPTADLNKYIKLKHRVESRMALVDLAGSNQDNILSGKCQEDAATKATEIQLDLDFRDRQLLSLRDETPDIEDLVGGVTLSDFTLDDFIADLLAFLEARRGELERSPLGLFAVVPPADDAVTPPGIIWCLRRRGELPNRRANARGVVPRFAPYYLIYVQDDGSIVLTFNEDKRLLSTLRALCQGKAVPWDGGCRTFDMRTKHGDDMSAIVASLECATREIAGAVRAVSARSLAQGGILDAATIKIKESLDGWDLISWVVIQDQ